MRIIEFNKVSAAEQIECFRALGDEDNIAINGTVEQEGFPLRTFDPVGAWALLWPTLAVKKVHVRFEANRVQDHITIAVAAAEFNEFSLREVLDARRDYTKKCRHAERNAYQ